MALSIDHFLPPALRSDAIPAAAPEAQRQAVLVIYAVGLSTIAVVLTLILLRTLGFVETVERLVWILPLQGLPWLVLRLSANPKLAGHTFLTLLFVEIAVDFGPDDGFSVVASVVLAAASWGLLGVGGGVIWTVIAMVWTGCLGPFVFRVNDYSPSISLSTAIVAFAVGLAAGLNEITRARALVAARRALVQLQEGRDTMKSFVEGAFPANVEISRGAFVKVSPAAADMLGYSVAELIGKRLSDLLSPAQLDELKARQGTFPRQGFRTEISLLSRTGELLWLECFVVPLDADSKAGGPRASIVGARNVSEERKHRERLIRAQRLESVGALAAGIAHDFNNLLTVISGFAELLPTSDSRTAILGASNNAAKLIADLMAFSRNAPSSPVCIDVADSIRRWRAVFTSLLGERHQLVLDLPVEPLGARITDGQLSQVLLNLAANARDAMSMGGTLTIRLRGGRVAQQLAEGRGLPAGQRYVCLTVKDTGSGMDEATRERAFDPFFTTKAPGHGTGLGLASVYGIVKQQLGHVEISSAPGQGTEVMVILREARIRPESGTTASERLRFSPAGRILLIEDNTLINDLITRTMIDSGHVVISCTSYDDALASLDGGRFDLMITDVVLSGRLGTDIAAEARRRDPMLPVLFVSGYSNVEQGPWVTDVSGRSVFLAKPFTIETLLTQVARLLDLGAAGEGPGGLKRPLPHP